jgi:hypothetical protein
MSYLPIQASAKRCIVCGLRLLEVDDFPAGDTHKDYCRFCGTQAALHPYEDLVSGMARYIVLTQGVKHQLAKMLARRAVDNSVAALTGRLVLMSK